MTVPVSAMLFLSPINTMFLHGFTAALLASVNKGAAAMLVGPLAIELYSYANVFFCFGSKTHQLITQVSRLYNFAGLKPNLKEEKKGKKKKKQHLSSKI